MSCPYLGTVLSNSNLVLALRILVRDAEQGRAKFRRGHMSRGGASAPRGAGHSHAGRSRYSPETSDESTDSNKSHPDRATDLGIMSLRVKVKVYTIILVSSKRRGFQTHHLHLEPYVDSVQRVRLPAEGRHGAAARAHRARQHADVPCYFRTARTSTSTSTCWRSS